LPEEKFDFLVTRLSLLLAEDGRAYLGTTPAKKRVIRICQAISSETGRNKILLDHRQWSQAQPDDERLANYFCLGPVSKAYRLWINTP